MISPPNSTELTSNAKAEPTILELPRPALPQRKARRNHSEIERRRRLKLNAKYNELRELVPNCRAFRFAKRGGDAGLHKLDILTEAVEYIRLLENERGSSKSESSSSASETRCEPGVSSSTAAPVAPAEPTAPVVPVPPAVQPLGRSAPPKHNISFLIN